MSHRVAHEPWGTVDIDTSTGRVFVQEDWFYVWLLYPGVTEPWTVAEKRRFHHRVDIGVWKLWSNHLHLNVGGTAPFAARRVPVNFDVRWRLGKPYQWTILAWKVPPGASPTSPVHSQVDWNNYVITLSSADVLERRAGNAAGRTTNDFRTPPHEFGHTMYLPDEYNAPTAAIPSPNLGDTGSIMNIGRQIRARHLALVVATLDRLIPTARFSA